jgi:hypothetical protein
MACKAAKGIFKGLYDLIVKIYADLSTIEPSEVFMALLNQNGWNPLELYNLLSEQQASIENESFILAELNAEKDDMICQLKNHSLDQTFVLDWVDSAFAGYTAVRPIVKAAINSAYTDGRWALWATVGMATETGECSEDCDTPTLALQTTAGFSSTLLQFIETNEDGDVYDLIADDTIHYSKLAVSSVGNVPFYILSAVPQAGAVFGTTIQTSMGTYRPDTIPCWLATTYINFYLNSNSGETDQITAGETLRITISHNPCHEIYLRPRTDSEYPLQTLTIAFIGFDSSGNVIYDVTNTGGNGNVRIGFDTVDESLTTLKSAYLVSATPPPGEAITYHYHEQENNIGDGSAGESGTISSKKWGFYGLSAINKTVRFVFSANPY